MSFYLLISCISVLVGTFRVYVLRGEDHVESVAFHDLESCITLICAVGRAESELKEQTHTSWKNVS